jgi:hypothetical protein
MDTRKYSGWIIGALLCIVFPPFLALGVLFMGALAVSNATKTDGNKGDRTNEM